MALLDRTEIDALNRAKLSNTKMLVSTPGDPTIHVWNAAQYHDRLDQLQAEGVARGIQSGGVRTPDMIARLPRDETPTALFFQLLDKAILAAFLGAAGSGAGAAEGAGSTSGGGMDFDLGLDFADFGNEAVNYADYLPVEDAVSTIDAIESASEYGVDYGSVPAGRTWYDGALDFGTDLAKSAVKQYVQQEVAGASRPAVRSTTQLPATRTPVYLPQQNLSAGGNRGMIYPELFDHGGYSSGGGFSSSASRAGSGIGSSPFSSMAILAVGAIFALMLALFFRR